MAFKAGVTKSIPETMDGIYLFPMWWFTYGVEHDFLEIEDTKKFANSLQGSVLSWMNQRLRKSKFDVALADHKLTLWKDDTQCDLWLIYEGEGKIQMLYYPTEGFVNKVKWPNSETYDNLEVMGLNEFSNLTINDQKSINGQYISLFAGCGVRIKERVWFTELSNLF